MSDQTLESLVSRYRRSGGDPALERAEVELEVRFRGVDFFIFETVLRALVAGELPVDKGVIEQTVNSIMPEDPAARRARHRGPQHNGANLIRQVRFAAGKKVGDRYYRKWPILAPFRVRSPHTLDYNVALSAEEPMAGEFSSDARATIRVKSRASFTTADTGAGGRWRIDLTVVRQIAGSDARSALGGVVQTMFRPSGAEVTPETMLEALDLETPESEMRSIYTYEIELEHLPGDAAGRDSARPAQLTALVENLLRLSNPEYLQEAVYQSEIFHVAGYIVAAPGLLRRFEHEWGLKKLAPSVTALTRADYKSIYPPTGYYLLDKADGVRALASVRGGRLRVLADELLEYYAPGFSAEGGAPAGSAEARNHRVVNPTIVDGELVKGPRGPVFHSFDVVVFAGENVSNDGYESRVGHLAAATAVLRDFGLDARPKPVVHLTAAEPDALEAQFKDRAFADRPYETDGRILVEPGKPYRETVSYKWKSLWDTTIDFLARRAPSSVLGRRPFVDAPGHELYLLFVGINPDLHDALGIERAPGYRDLFGGGQRVNTGSYAPIQFAPSDAPLAYLYQHPTEKPAEKGWEGWTRDIEGKVVELRCAGGCVAAGTLGLPDWQLVRVREDRTRELKTLQYFGNDFRTAELTWLNYVDPFTEEQLWEGPSLGYFATPKSALYRAQTAFTSFVKSQRIERDLAHAAWVVDLAVGKGQDFGRYLNAGVRHLVGVDEDRGALSDLVRRKYSHAVGQKDRRKGGRGRGARRQDGTTALYVLHADLKQPHEQTVAAVHEVVGFPTDGADAVVCNLAVHYFAENVVLIRNFAALCRGLVKVGGTVILTTMFGHKVHELLEQNQVGLGASWDSRQEGVVKYSIRRGYAEESLTAAGQRVGVLLPFSAGEYYDEFLVNVGTLTDEFVSRGFRPLATPTFDSLFGEFEARNPTMSKMLSGDDFTYLGLYGEVVFRREK